VGRTLGKRAQWAVKKRAQWAVKKRAQWAVKKRAQWAVKKRAQWAVRGWVSGTRSATLQGGAHLLTKRDQL
jgi:hypothetical protein